MNSPDPGIGLIVATVAGATPLMLAAMGGVLSERSGVANIGLEGMMLAGAFAGVAAGGSSGLTGVAAALAAGAALGLLHAVLTQTLKVNHIISGLGINLLSAGTTRFLFLRYSSQGVHIDGLPDAAFVIPALTLPFLIAFTLRRTRFGLRLRAVGENPESARLAGIAPWRTRVAAVTASGALAASGGAYLSMADAHTFASNMTAGKGYVALAAVIFGKWNPYGAAGGALFFGLCFAVQSQLQIAGYKLTWLGVEWSSPYLLDSLPYVVTLIALVSAVGRSAAPSALIRQES